MIAFRLLFVGILSSASILLTSSQITIAQTQLTPQEISAIAKPITVRIDGTDEGSGVIIEKSKTTYASETTYTVLTNWHVIREPGQYTVKTIDGQEHSVDYSQIQKLSDDVDLALVKFTSKIEYKIAELGESDKLGEGQTIHLAGYPGSGQIRGESDRFYRFYSLSINAILPNSREGAYSLAYGGENFSGMSGSPILNSDGEIIGINGIAYLDSEGKARANYAIPIDIYNQSQPTLALNSSEIVAKASEIAAKVQQFTVQIDGEETGTGTIIERNGNTYKVITTRHVMDTPGVYQVMTPDGVIYQVGEVKNLNDADLAIVKFISSNSYPVAELGDSEAISPGTNTYVAGYTDPFPGFPERAYTFLRASLVVSQLSKGEQGYTIIHDNPTPPGTSGGGIFDTNGSLIGINGRVISEGNTGKVFGAGIPIKIYLAEQNNLNTSAGF